MTWAPRRASRSSSVRPELAGEDLVVVLAEQRRVALRLGRGVDQPPRDALLLVADHLRVGEVVPVAAVQQVQVVVDRAGVEHPAGGHAGGLEHLHRDLRPLRRRPRADRLVELVVACPALVERQAGEVVAADDRAQRPPLVVGAHRDDEPLLLAARAVHALRGEAVVAAAEVDDLVAARRGDERLADQAHRPLALGEVDEAPALAGVPGGEPEHGGRHGVQPGDGIAVRDARLERLAVAVAGQRGETGHQLDHRPEADVLRRRAPPCRTPPC